MTTEPLTILPTAYLTRDNPPTSPEQFIGGARLAAQAMQKIVASSKANGFAPIKLFYAGPSGVGKTALAYYLAHLLRASQWAVSEHNGTDLTIDVMRGLADSLHLCHNELFGDYRILAWHEADKIRSDAQVRGLSLIDNLPKRTAIIATSNEELNDMEVRFQRRFKFTKIAGATSDEIMQLVMRWPVPEAVARGIAMGACGNVGLALQEAEEWLQTNTTEKAA